MNISDISKVERKAGFLCVLFTRRNKDNHVDECSIKYSQAPHPDLEKAWDAVRGELVAMVPEWEDVTLGLDQISRTLKKKEWIYGAKMSIWPHDEVLPYDRELILKISRLPWACAMRSMISGERLGHISRASGRRPCCNLNKKK